MKIAVLMACYNRREKTLACLERLRVAVEHSHVDWQLFLFDDGCTDGTSEAVLSVLPDAQIIRGDGGFFWNRSMSQVFSAALEHRFDAYLWLNDDTMLNPESLGLLREALSFGGEGASIAVGIVCDEITGRTSYGGLRDVNPRWRPFLAALVDPSGTPQDVDVMNGNVVLIPDGAARRIGSLDAVFEHAMGDTDYSKRARKLGLRVVATAGFVGTCSRNSTKGTHWDKGASLMTRLSFIFSRKGLPLRSWFVMCWRHGGWLWPIHFVWGYFRVVLGRS